MKHYIDIHEIFTLCYSEKNYKIGVICDADTWKKVHQRFIQSIFGQFQKCNDRSSVTLQNDSGIEWIPTDKTDTWMKAHGFNEIFCQENINLNPELICLIDTHIKTDKIGWINPIV